MQLSKEFLSSLRAFDQTLDGVFDIEQDSVHLWSSRGGVKELVLTLNRDYGESYESCSRRALAKLHEMDVWKKFGSADKYDDHLEKAEQEYRAKKKEEYQQKRQLMFKEHETEIKDAIKNANSGVFSGKAKYKTKKFI